MISTRNDKRIVKNTLYLYGRLFVAMILSVYTSRLILQSLGETDFGIYNVVGGVVVMLNFLNSTLLVSTQRYLNMSIGEKSLSYAKDIYHASLRIHFVLSLLIVLLAETVGLWFVNNTLNIPEERMFAANIIFQFSIAAVFFSINVAPLQAMVIAQEKLGIYAVLSILDIIAKFIVACLLFVTAFDKLIVYGISFAVIGFVDFLLYKVVTIRSFEECRGEHKIHRKNIYRSMLSFSSWTIIGSLASTLSDQGINMLLNVFFGPVVNAARGLAMTLNGYLYSFVANFTMSANPQIVKTFSAKEYDSMYDLMLKMVRFSTFLFSFLAIPFLFESNFVLDLWLKNVPQYTTLFCQIIVLQSFVICISQPLVSSCNAIGCVKQVNLTIGVMYILSFFLSWLLLAIYSNVLIPFIIIFVSKAIAIGIYVFFIMKYINIDMKKFYINGILKTLVTFIPTTLLLLILHAMLDEGWARFMIICFTSTVLLSISIYFIGIENHEKIRAVSFVRKKLFNK